MSCNVLTTRHNDDNKQDNDADDDADAHLHILPPHLLAHPVGAAPETLRRRRQVVGLILQIVEPLAAFAGLLKIRAHHIDRALDFLKVGGGRLAGLPLGTCAELMGRALILRSCY